MLYPHTHSLFMLSGAGGPCPRGPVGVGCVEHLAFSGIRLMPLRDRAQSVWLPHSAGGGHASRESFLAGTAKDGPVMSCAACGIFQGEYSEMCKNTLIAALFTTVRNRNSSNTGSREPAKSTMIHIMEHSCRISWKIIY